MRRLPHPDRIATCDVNADLLAEMNSIYIDMSIVRTFENRSEEPDLESYCQVHDEFGKLYTVLHKGIFNIEH